MKRNWFIAVFLILILMASACAGPTDVEQDDQADQAAVQGEDKNGVENGTEEEIELKLVYWESAYTDVLRQAASEFGEMHPNVSIELEVPAGDYLSVLTTRIMSGEAPDLFMYFGSSVFKMAQNGYWGTFDESEEWVDALIPAFKDSMIYEDEIYAYPFDCSGEAVYYNKRVFADNGIEVPGTYEEFLDACDKLADVGITPIAMGAKDNWTSYHAFSMVLASYQSMYDPEFGLRLYDGEATFAESNYGLALERFKTLYDRQYFGEGILGIELNQAAQSVVDGEAGMLMLNNYATSLFQSLDPAVEIGCFAFPNDEGEAAVVAYVDKAIGYSPSGEHVEMSKAFISYLAQPEVTAYILEGVQALACRTDVELDLPAASQELSELTQTLDVFAFFDAFWPGSCNTIMDKGITSLLSGNDDIDQILRDLDETYVEDKDSVIRPLLPY